MKLSKKIHPDVDGFCVKTSRHTFHAQKVILATGFFDLPYLLNIPGENLPKVRHYYDDPHPYYDMNIVVIGAANSAVDVALETYRKGAKSVTMVIREQEISSRVKYWVKPDIINRIKEGSIKAYFNSNLKVITEATVQISTPDEDLEIKNDFVLAMTGFQPNFDFLQSLGIKIGSDEFKTPDYNPTTMQTNVEGIYLAGVICGGLKTNAWFIENSRVHAEIIIGHILSTQEVSE